MRYAKTGLATGLLNCEFLYTGTVASMIAWVVETNSLF
jgi:hypothetical protein